MNHKKAAVASIHKLLPMLPVLFKKNQLHGRDTTTNGFCQKHQSNNSLKDHIRQARFAIPKPISDLFKGSR